MGNLARWQEERWQDEQTEAGNQSRGRPGGVARDPGEARHGLHGPVRSAPMGRVCYLESARRARENKVQNWGWADRERRFGVPHAWTQDSLADVPAPCNGREIRRDYRKPCMQPDCYDGSMSWNDPELNDEARDRLGRMHFADALDS